MLWPSFLISPFKMIGCGRDGALKQGDGETCRIALDEMQTGQCGVVRDLNLSKSDDNRLRTLGICPGQRVWLVRRGDPMVLKVMGTRLGLAAELAEQVTVEVCAPPWPGFQDIPPIRLEREPGETGK